MTSNFWTKLPKPIFALAPMANVTDRAFRQIIAKYGKPDVMFTEFTSCDGLQSPGRDNLLIDLKYSPAERPMVAQIFGSKPNNFYQTARLCQELGFDGIDINMGCPDRNVEKQCAGAALMKDHKLAQACIAEAKRGGGDLPISVKTRLGFNKNEVDTWLPALLQTGLAAITLHARTRKEMSSVPARWNEVARAVKIRDEFFGRGVLQYAPTLILGNGDITTMAEAREKIADTGADGVMIGRGIFGNPWLFKNCRSKGNPNYEPTTKEKLLVMVEHTHLFEKLLSENKNFAIMKKHYKAYVNDFAGAKELRVKLMEEASDATAVERIVKEFLTTFY